MRLSACGLAAVITAGAACGGGHVKGDGGIIGHGGNTGGGFRITFQAVAYRRDIDILFMIDDSSSMRLAQDNLRRNFSSFVAGLQALPGGLPNIHLAVVSSDMGAGDGSISGCDSSGGKKGIFQYTGHVIPPATAPCTTTLNAGATYISNIGGVANYTGALEDAFSCIAALGEAGCGMEHQFAAITRALGVDGLGAAPAQNQGFLRPDAALAIVMLTNEDDCSASLGQGPNGRIPLFDTGANTNIASQLGPPVNFRCNEFGHMCSRGSGAPGHPDRNAPNLDVNAMVTYDSCASNDSDGFLLGAADTADKLKSLKNDPSLVAVAAITGPATPYTVTWKAPSAVDTSCNTTMQTCPWPVIAHSCTASDGSFADPGVRIGDFVDQFGANGLLLPICAADLAPSLGRAAALIGTTIAPVCITRAIADDPSKSGIQPDCIVTLNGKQPNGMTVETPLPACADNSGAAPCWQLLKGVEGCAGSSISVMPDPAAAMPSDVVHFDCAVCASDASVDCF